MLLKSIYAFLIGGAFCAIAQILIDKTKLTPARILVFYVSLGIFLGGVGLYEPLFKLSGCGASLPLVGFGGAVAKGVREAVDKDGVFGIFGGALSAAAAGTSVSLFLGFLASLFFRGKPKRF